MTTRRQFLRFLGLAPVVGAGVLAGLKAGSIRNPPEPGEVFAIPSGPGGKWRWYAEATSGFKMTPNTSGTIMTNCTFTPSHNGGPLQFLEDEPDLYEW